MRAHYGCFDARFEIARRSSLVRVVEVQAVNNLAVRFYGLQHQVSALDAYEHRVVGGLREGRQRTLAGWVQPPAASPAHYVGHSPYGHCALVDVVVAGED